MTVKERLYQLVEELSDEVMPEAEGYLARLRDQGREAPANRFRSSALPTDGRSPEERRRALRKFNEFVEGLPKTGRLLTEEDVSRESLYKGRL